jgi:hypothetical protein
MDSTSSTPQPKAIKGTWKFSPKAIEIEALRRNTVNNIIILIII